MSYFKYFPQTTFDSKSVADITRKAKISKVVSDNALDYMSYTIEEGERPEDVAYYYYDDPSLAWLVLMSNDIVDVYSEWPRLTSDVEKHIMKKYESASGTTGTAVLDWSKNATIAGNIIHYQSTNDPDLRMNRASFINLGNTGLIRGDEIKAGEEYTIVSLGTLGSDLWAQLTGATYTLENPVAVGQTFTALVAGNTIIDSNTTQVELSSLKNPAREFYAVRAYDYEIELNESKREIQLVNKGYVSTLKDQLETILKDA